MESEEVDAALEELESRLERLRALYEQYFLGIEKLEPQIPRKDVDRRIYVLRREKIRNTGKRFKLQTLISRYNTFQQYWQRICREIENGTYKRHLLRAEKTVGPNVLLTAAARRRFGREKALRDSQKPPADVAANDAAAANPISDAPPRVPSSSPPEPASVRPRSRTPTWPGIPTPPPPSAGPAPAPFVAPAAPPPAGAQTPAAPERLAAAAERAVPASSVPAGRPAPSSSPRKQQFESLELDMDFMGDWDPQTAAKGRSAVGARPQPATPPAEPAPKAPPRDAQREALEAQRAARERAAARRPEPSAEAAAPAKPTAPHAPQVERPPAAPAAATAAAAGAPAPAAVSPSVAPRRLAPPPKPKRDPSAAVPQSVAPSAPPQPPPERKAARPPTERPPPPQPADPAKVAARARAARQKAVEPVSDGKLRELHQRLAEVSKSAGQPAVSFDGLSKSLRAAEAKLREKHGNRRIDFEVVLKDGKAVVKPVVR